MMTLVEWQSCWLDHLRGERGLAELTLKSYQRLILLDITYLADQGVSKPQQLTTALLERCLVNWRREGLGERSIALKLSAWRTFCDF